MIDPQAQTWQDIYGKKWGEGAWVSRDLWVPELPKRKKHPTLPLFDSGDPDLARKVDEMFGSGNGSSG